MVDGRCRAFMMDNFRGRPICNIPILEMNVPKNLAYPTILLILDRRWVNQLRIPETLVREGSSPMPINMLPKDTPRGKGPEPTSITMAAEALDEEQKSKEEDLAAQEIQDLWESQEIGITNWSTEGGDRYSDPGA